MECGIFTRFTLRSNRQVRSTISEPSMDWFCCPKKFLFPFANRFDEPQIVTPIHIAFHSPASTSSSTTKEEHGRDELPPSNLDYKHIRLILTTSPLVLLLPAILLLIDMFVFFGRFDALLLLMMMMMRKKKKKRKY